MNQNQTFKILTALLLFGGIADARKCIAELPVTTKSGLVNLRVEDMEIAMAHPKAWVATVVKADPAKPVAEQLSVVRFKVDDQETVVALLRNQLELPSGTKGEKHIEKSAAELRAVRKANGVRVLLDEATTVADSPGWLSEIETESGGHAIRVLTVTFVGGNREYKVAFAGQRDFYGDVRPAVMAWIKSFEWIDKKQADQTTPAAPAKTNL